MYFLPFFQGSKYYLCDKDKKVNVYVRRDTSTKNNLNLRESQMFFTVLKVHKYEIKGKNINKKMT